MAIIRNIVKSILPPEDTAEMWLDGEGKLRAYTLGVWKEVSATEVNSEEVIKASQSYPYNAQYKIDSSAASKLFEEISTFEGDLKILYDIIGKTDMRLFAEGSFLANHVKKVNIMGIDVEDMASLPDILTMINNTYSVNRNNEISVKFTLDTDTIEGDLFGFDYHSVGNLVPLPTYISVNCKVKSLDCSHILVAFVLSMLNSPTEILEQGSIKGNFGYLVLPLALKHLEENAFTNCSAEALFMMSQTVPESLPQSLSINSKVYFPALFGERTYKDYVKDVFNIDVTTEVGAAKVLCFDVSTGSQVTFKQS